MRADKKAPIYGRLTYKNSRKNFSTGIYTKASHWNTKTNKVRQNPEANLLLSKIYNDIQKEIIISTIKGEYNVTDIYKSVFSTTKEITLLDGVRKFIDHIKSLVGIDYKESTYLKYRYMYTQIEDYLKHSNKGTGFMPSQIDTKFLYDIEHYYKTVKQYNDRNTHKNMQRFRTLTGFLIREEIISKNPFDNYTFPKYKKHIIYLSADELKRLEKITIDDERLENLRKLMVFICYTGLGYAEYKAFKKSDIEKRKGVEYINVHRVKTDSDYIIPLLPKAKAILEYFDYELPQLSNQKMNKNLKVIIKLIGVSKNVTAHSLRKTFASTVLLNNGFSMGVTSKLLGHSSISVTESTYAEFDKDYLLQQFADTG